MVVVATINNIVYPTVCHVHVWEAPKVSDSSSREHCIIMGTSVAGKFRSICKLLALFVFALPSQTCKLASLVCLDFNFFYPSILAIRVASFSWKTILRDCHYFPSQKTQEKLSKNEKFCSNFLKKLSKIVDFHIFCR